MRRLRWGLPHSEFSKMKKHFTSQALALTAAICAGTASATAADSVEARLEKLEAQLNALSQENTELRKQLGWDGKSTINHVEEKGKVSKMALGGFIQAQFAAGDAPDARFNLTGGADSFSVRRARINLVGEYAEHFDYKLEMDFAGLSSAMRAQLTDGYLNWSRHPAANIKLGQFKTPFGYEQLTSDTKVLTAERSLPNDFLTFGRQLGAGVGGDIVEKRLKYSAGVFNGNNANIGINDADNFMVAGRIDGVALKKKVQDKDLTWNAGLNGIHSVDTASTVPGFGFRTNPTGAANNVFAGTRYGFGADTQVNWSRFGLFAEYLWMNFEPDNGNLTVTTADDQFSSNGFYVGGTFDIVPKKWQALVRYDVLDTEDGNGLADGNEVVLGLNYYIKGDDIKLVANYIIGDPDQGDGGGRFILRAQLVF